MARPVNPFPRSSDTLPVCSRAPSSQEIGPPDPERRPVVAASDMRPWRTSNAGERGQDPPIIAAARMVGGSWSPGGPETPRVLESFEMVGGSWSLFGPDPDFVAQVCDGWRILVGFVAVRTRLS
jgi:hypothetical protein